MNNVFELYYDQTPTRLCQPTSILRVLCHAIHTHKCIQYIWYYMYIEQTNTRSIYYIFLKPSLCHRDVCVRGVNVNMCVFVILFSRTTISFRAMHVTYIFIVHSAFNGHRHYSRNIVFSGSSYIPSYTILLHAPFYFKHPTGNGIMAFQVCVYTNEI